MSRTTGLENLKEAIDNISGTKSRLKKDKKKKDDKEKEEINDEKKKGQIENSYFSFASSFCSVPLYDTTLFLA